MEDFKRIWSGKYPIHWFDTDQYNRISLMAMCRYLQESAWHHANHLGFGYMENDEIKHTWVIVRQEITPSEAVFRGIRSEDDKPVFRVKLAFLPA